MRNLWKKIPSDITLYLITLHLHRLRAKECSEEWFETSFFILKWITFVLKDKKYFKGRKDSFVLIFKRMARMYLRFLITLYLLVVRCCKQTQSNKVSIFRSLFGVFSVLCLLLFTFRLYQCFRRLFIGSSEMLSF